MKKVTSVLCVSLVASVAVFLMASGAGAGSDRNCSSFTGGLIPAGTHNFNVIVDANCTLKEGATLNGSFTQEDSSATWFIRTEEGSSVRGNIENKGSGLVEVNAGPLVAGTPFSGSIKDEGAGSVKVEVSDGDTYNGNIEEKGVGDVLLVIRGTGDYNGNVNEEDAGTCTVTLIAAPGQPRGNKEGGCA